MEKNTEKHAVQILLSACFLVIASAILCLAKLILLNDRYIPIYQTGITVGQKGE
ncbi:MAG: hypothetical protein J6Y89_08670 [Lachnospiraceae bacterium]|nr:hypothetical protein [Lachnospiraceae bacterium]